jgi:hypothetical protein
MSQLPSSPTTCADVALQIEEADLQTIEATKVNRESLVPVVCDVKDA